MLLCSLKVEKRKLCLLIQKQSTIEKVPYDFGYDQVDNFDFIYAQIKNLRKKLKDSGATIEIKAVYGFGYKMIVE